jgi:hypothetical protein
MWFALKRMGMCRLPESCGRGWGRERSSVLGLGACVRLLLVVAIVPSLVLPRVLLFNSNPTGGLAFTLAGALASSPAMNLVLSSSPATAASK